MVTYNRGLAISVLALGSRCLALIEKGKIVIYHFYRHYSLNLANEMPRMFRFRLPVSKAKTMTLMIPTNRPSLMLC